MKKLFVTVALAVCFLTPSMAQGDLKLGVNAGFPVGDVRDNSNFHSGFDVAYLVGVLEMIEIGAMGGYSHYSGEGSAGSLQFLPIAAVGRVGLPQGFKVGLDLGYAMGLNNEGGLYYRPQVGYKFFMLGLFLAYEGISDDELNPSSINLGLEIEL